MLLAEVASVSITDVVGKILFQIYGGDYPQHPLALHQVAARAVTVYFVGLVIIRLGKSRMISRATVLDVILGFILGSLLSRGITGSASISGTLVASAAIVALHWIFTSIAYHSHRFGSLIKGDMRLLVQNGEMLEENMRRSHLSKHDLMEHCRLRGVGDLQQVHAAYKERSGEISVIRRPPEPRVLDVAVDNGVQTLRIVLE